MDTYLDNKPHIISYIPASIWIFRNLNADLERLNWPYVTKAAGTLDFESIANGMCLGRWSIYKTNNVEEWLNFFREAVAILFMRRS